MKLAHTMIRVRDLERSLDFYSNFLGLHEVRRKDLGDAILVFLADEDGHHFIELTFNKDGRDYELGSQLPSLRETSMLSLRRCRVWGGIIAVAARKLDRNTSL